MGWLLDHVPLWVWLALAAAALFAAWRFLGWRGVIAVLAAIVTAGAYRAGRKSGSDDALQNVKKANEQAVKDHDRIESETDRMSDAELDAANAPWVRQRKR